MFLRRFTRKSSGKLHFYFALVENARSGLRVRQRIVAYLGELSYSDQQRWRRTVVFHTRQGEERQLQLFPEDETVVLPDDPDVVRIRLKTVGWTNARAFGDVWIALWLWRQLKLDEIVDRHIPQRGETIRPAEVVAIEVINRLCAPCSEFALAEHWYASTALEDLLGVPDSAVTKDRLYRTLDRLIKAKKPIESDLKGQLGALFDLKFDILLYDLTSSYFEGLAEENELAARGYSRDHRGDCKQIVLALVVTRDGFPLAHEVLVGNTKDVQTVSSIVQTVEERFGKSDRVWVMDRGMVSEENVAFLSSEGRRYLLGTRRDLMKKFQQELSDPKDWHRLQDVVEVKKVVRGDLAFLLARSSQRRKKERAIRRRQLLGLYQAVRKLEKSVRAGRVKKRDKILVRLGRLAERYPKARRFLHWEVDPKNKVAWHWKLKELSEAMARDGAYLLQSNHSGWTPEEFWQTYMQLTAAEQAFRTLKSDLLIRPIWHHYGQRTEAHVMVCVLAYALWRTLDEFVKRAKLMTLIHKPDEERPQGTPKPRPMSPASLLREMARIQIGDIQLETTAGQKLALRRVARPNAEQARILEALRLKLPERLSPDRIL